MGGCGGERGAGLAEEALPSTFVATDTEPVTEAAAAPPTPNTLRRDPAPGKVTQAQLMPTAAHSVALCPSFMHATHAFGRAHTLEHEQLKP